MSQKNTEMDAKLKHLELIQAVVARMAANSFLLKGWTVTLVAAVLALAAGKDGNPRLVAVGYLPVFVFWFLDAYFLRQERLYRDLYDLVCRKNPDQIDFCLVAPADGKGSSRVRTFFSGTLCWFYGAVLLAVVAAQLILGGA